VESLAALRAFELGGLYVCFGGRKFFEGRQQDRKLVIAYYLFGGREERGAESTRLRLMATARQVEQRA
jgi:hypothetical protein